MALPKLTGPDTGAAGPPHSGSRGLKVLVVVLVVLDVIAAGFYGYLSLFEYRNVRQERSRLEKQLVRVKTGADGVIQQVRRLRADDTVSVRDPRTPVLSAARDLGILQNLTVRNPTPRDWRPNPNYEQWQVRVDFGDRLGYEFEDLIRLLQEIEKRSPKVQVQKINFGQRRQQEEQADRWNPLEMTIRVFKPARRE